jgi:hypothetical protein
VSKERSSPKARRKRRASADTCPPLVDGAPDGPVPFHYPAASYREELFARA